MSDEALRELRKRIDDLEACVQELESDLRKRESDERAAYERRHMYGDD